MSERPFALHHDNIMPFYLVEDRLRENFSSISQFIAQQQLTNEASTRNTTEARADLQEFQQQIDKKFVEVERRIVQEIGKELDGRIIVAINKNMASFTSRMEEKEQQIGQATEGVDLKLEDMRKKILYESSKEQTKVMGKELEKLEKKMRTTFEELGKRTQSSGKGPSSLGRPAQSRETQPLSSPKTSLSDSYTAPEHHFTEEWALRIKQVEAKTAKLEEFLVRFDKRFYENMSALKESWKEVGEDGLQTKKKLTARLDEMRLELVKVRGLKEFEKAPADIAEDSFKRKLMDKFADVYQLLGQLVTRTDMESEVERVKKTGLRHDGELNDLREENGRNSDYFTFYVNNSDTDDLSAQLKAVRQEIGGQFLAQGEGLARQGELWEQVKRGLRTVEQGVEGLGAKEEELEARCGRLREEQLRETRRVDALEELNNFTPQKMAKIHDTLDIDFSPNEQDLVAKKEGSFLQSAAMKELKSELHKLKDDFFVLTHQQKEVDQIKKMFSSLELRIDKLKVESEEAILTRKPWVCLSCDKNEREKQEHERVRRDASRKRLQGEKGNLFTNREKSERAIKLGPGEDKFEVYQRYREKYLSEAVKLPDIYREKVGDKDPTLN